MNEIVAKVIGVLGERARWPVAASAMFALAGLASAQSAPTINDTGVNRCLNARGEVTTQCANKGQDASFGRDVTDPDPSDGRRGFSFVKVDASGADLPSAATEWACVRDRITGYMWEVKTNDGGLRDVDNKYFYRRSFLNDDGEILQPDAQAFANNVNAQGLCGHADWRLPNRLELSSLVDFGKLASGAMIDADYFPNTLADVYWVIKDSDVFALEPMNVSFFSGSQTKANFGPPSSFPARLVRGPAAFDPSNRFSVQDDEAFDAFTGLVWRRCQLGRQWNGTICEGSAKEFTWPQAMAQAQKVSQETGKAWRLPNIQELGSLYTDDPSYPTYDRVAFPGQDLSLTWSSTPAKRFESGPWVPRMFTFALGFPAIISTETSNPNGLVRLVRDAP